MAYSPEALQRAITYLRGDTGRHFDDWGIERPELNDHPVIETARSVADYLEEFIAHPHNYGKPPIFQISTRAEMGFPGVHTSEQAEESSRCAADVIFSVRIAATLPIQRVQSSPQEIAEGRSPYMIEIDLRPSQVNP